MENDGGSQRVDDGLVAGMTVEIHSVPIWDPENADNDEKGRRWPSHRDNGERGTLKGYDEEQGRWHVVISPDNMCFVKAAHLRPLAPEDSAGDTAASRVSAPGHRGVQDDFKARVELAKSLREHARKLEAQAAELLPTPGSYGPVQGGGYRMPPHGDPNGGPGYLYGTFPKPGANQPEHWTSGLDTSEKLPISENLPIFVMAIIVMMALILGLIFGKSAALRPNTHTNTHTHTHTRTHTHTHTHTGSVYMNAGPHGGRKHSDALHPQTHAHARACTHTHCRQWRHGRWSPWRARGRTERLILMGCVCVYVCMLYIHIFIW